MELELRHLFGYARRWWWLLLLLPALAASIDYALISRKQPLYSANATLVIRPAQDGGGANDLNVIQSGQRLAATYQQLVATEPVLRPVAERLGAPYTAATLKGLVSVTTVGTTNLLRISVSNTSPEEAAAIANAVAAEFQTFIAQQELASTSSSQAGLQQLIDDTNAQIANVQQQITDLEAVAAPDAAQQGELDRLRGRLSQLEGSMTTLMVQQQSLDLSTTSLQNQARVYVPATVPSSPYAPRVLFYTVLAGFAGGLIAVGAVALLEYLDNTVKSSLDFQAVFRATLLSAVPTIPKLMTGKDQAFILTHPTSNSAEALRLLRTNIEFAAASHEITSMMVTSAVPGEGKSTITANLALAMAQAGFSVVLIDADLRRPSQHRIFALDNRRGVTTLLTHPEMQWGEAAADIIPGLRVLSSGPIPPNPADLLSTERFRGLVGDIGKTVDIVLVDTPPVLAVSDPLTISTLTDAVLIVTLAGVTRIGALQRAIQSFPESARIIGCVVNQQERGRDGDYYYYSGYYGVDEGQASRAPRPSRSLIRRASKEPISPSSPASGA